MTVRLQTPFLITCASVATALFTSAAPGAPVARVAFDLTTDAVEQPKRRPGESDQKHAARCAATLPHSVQVPAEYFDGLKDRCQDIVRGLGEITAHYGLRAALEHALLAEGKAPPGVKQLKVGGVLGSAGAADRKKV